MWCLVLPIVLYFFLQLAQVNALKGDGQCGYLVCVNATVHHDTVTCEISFPVGPFPRHHSYSFLQTK